MGDRATRSAGVMGRSRLGAFVLVALLAVSACGETAPILPSGSATSVPASGPAIRSDAPVPSTDPVPSLTIAVGGNVTGGLSNAARGADAIRASGFIHDGLYGLDASLAPVPRLARELATVSADGLTWTLRLRDDVTFADGSPLTAEDVVRTYEIAASQRCPYRPGVCLAGILERVTSVDEATVVFTLTAPLAAFATTYLGIGVERAAAIDASYAAFVAGLGDVSATDTAAFLGAVAAEEADPSGPAGEDGAETVDHETLRTAGEALLARAGVDPPAPAEHTVAGALDAPSYVAELVARVRAIDATFTSRPTDALAAAYPFLDVARAPVTTGPFQLASGSAGAGGAGGAGGDLELVANETYFLGRPEIDRIVLRRVASDADGTAALLRGGADWRPALTPEAYAAIRDVPDIRIVEYPEFGFYGLTFNLHPEADGLFADRDLRRAVALCFDHAAAVQAATGGDAAAIDSEIPMMSWAYPDSGLAAYPLDPERATDLIEGAGWERGSDGIFAKDGRRLSTAVPLREGFPERTTWLREVSEDVRSCGIDLQVAEVSFDAILRMLAVYPHVNAAAPDDGQPFDAYFGGLDTRLDPDPFRLYHSSECSSAERPDTFNFGCYQDPEVDRLIEAARVDEDIATRIANYRDYAIRISEDLPVIYAWSDLVREGIRSSIRTTAPGGLRSDTPTWTGPLERLTNVR